MRVYADSSALLKRIVSEPESEALIAALDRHQADGDAVVSSSLAWVEVARAAQARSAAAVAALDPGLVEAALSGVFEHGIGPEVVALARRLRPSTLRTLDAIHVASAILLDVELVLAYDVRLAAACEENGLTVAAPGT